MTANEIYLTTQKYRTRYSISRRGKITKLHYDGKSSHWTRSNKLTKKHRIVYLKDSDYLMALESIKTEILEEIFSIPYPDVTEKILSRLTPLADSLKIFKLLEKRME
jgi:hypothetical protein